MGATPWGRATPFSPSAAAPGRVTSLRVSDVRRDSVTLAWTPVPSASGYVLSWSPAAGEEGTWLGGRLAVQMGARCPQGGLLSPSLLILLGRQPAARHGGRCRAPPAPSRSPGCAWASATPSPSARSSAARRGPRPPSASAQVPPGAGEGVTRGGDGPILVAASPLPLAVCRDARGDIVFLVHGTRDSSSGAEAVRSLLSNTVTALGRLGPDGTQVGGCRGGCRPCPFRS